MAKVCVVGNATKDLNRTGLIAARRPGGTLLYASLALQALGHEVIPVGRAPLRAYVWLRRAGLPLDELRPAFPGTQFLNVYEEGTREQWARPGPARAVDGALELDGVEGLLLGPVLHEIPRDLPVPNHLPSLLDVQGLLRKLGQANLLGWRKISLSTGPVELPPASHIRGSLSEAMALTRTQDPVAAAHELHELTGRPAVVTLGAQGAIATAGQALKAEPEPLDVEDPTGAGDVFDAGLLHGLMADWSMDRCLAWACAAATCFLERDWSGQPSHRFAGIEEVSRRAEAVNVGPAG